MGDEPVRTEGAADRAAPVEAPSAGWDGPTLTVQLKNLHGCDDSDKMPRDTVVVMHESEDVRRTLVRALSIILPGFNIDLSTSPGEVVARLAGDVGAKAALVLAEIDDTAKNAAILQPFYASSRRAEFVNVPLVALSQDLPMALERGDVTDVQLDRLGIDGVLEIPYLERLRGVMSQAIMKRSRIFEEAEKAKKSEIMTAFFKYYIALVTSWMESLEEVSFYPKDSEDLATPESKESVLVEIMVTLRTLSEQLMEWQKLPEDTDLKMVRKLSHDVANSLAVPMANLGWLTRSCDEAGTSDKNILKIMLDEIIFLNEYKKAVDNARKGKRTWSSITTEGLMLSPAQALEFPRGTVFCIIDDSQGVLNTCKAEIGRQGGVVHTAKNHGEFIELLAMPDGLPENTVFLVDNDLGRRFNGTDAGSTDEVTHYGHELIDVIKKAFPRAVVVCHTSDAVDINGMADNPYRKARVEVIDKRGWNRLTEILKYSLGTSI